jgi:hypothetical protein
MDAPMSTTLALKADVESVLDLFQPDELLNVVRYQASVPASIWEQRHIDGMVEVCEYIRLTYSNLYPMVESIHRKFRYMEPSY